MEKESTRVCVTGASGYIGSWLINKLLQKGYRVHATLRNLGDESKVGLLKNLHGAESRLLLFEADVYNPEEFEPAIRGCEFVFLVATPFMHYASSKYNSTTEAAVAAVLSILNVCEQSGSVKRVIYIGSVMAASPLKEDGTSFKDFIDESCWTPLHLSFAHSEDPEKYSNTTEAAVAAVSCILNLCEQSGSVKRVIYTGSVTAASPLKEDGTGFKDFIDESCWTPLCLSFAHCEDFEKAYTCSKTLSEHELLNYKAKKEDGMEVVSLTCGLVGGDALVPNAPLSVKIFTSLLTGDLLCYRQLKFMQALIGSIPAVHIEDVCDAHIFCMEKSSMSGRFLCASAYTTIQEFVEYYEHKCPSARLTKEFEGTEGVVRCNSQKLAEEGFKYRYGLKQVLDDSVACMKRLEGLGGLS